MHTFFDLFAQGSAREDYSTDPTWADRQFDRYVENSPLRLWRPGDPVRQQGVRILIGVATWSGYDMKLLDVIAESQLQRQGNAPLVEIFNTAECRHSRDLKNHIPGLRSAFHTPFVGIWRDGQLSWAGEGYEARDQVARMFGSGSAEIVQQVEDWIKARTPSGGC